MTSNLTINKNVNQFQDRVQNRKQCSMGGINKTGNHKDNSVNDNIKREEPNLRNPVSQLDADGPTSVLTVWVSGEHMWAGGPLCLAPPF